MASIEVVLWILALSVALYLLGAMKAFICWVKATRVPGYRESGLTAYDRFIGWACTRYNIETEEELKSLDGALPIWEITRIFRRRLHPKSEPFNEDNMHWSRIQDDDVR